VKESDFVSLVISSLILFLKKIGKVKIRSLYSDVDLELAGVSR
jgi:hypothetical protein